MENMAFKTEKIEALINQYYGLEVTATTLKGYDELNFLLVDAAGNKYICKIATQVHGYEFLEAQVNILRHLSGSPVADRFQRCLVSKNGEELIRISGKGIEYYLRVLSFLEGEFWVESKNHGTALVEDLGHFLGEMDKSLETFRHLAMHRRYTWDIQTALDRRSDLKYIKDPGNRRVAAYF